MADEQTTTTNTGTPPANGGNQGGQQPQGGADPALINMTSAQLAERLDRAKSGAVGELLKALGFEKPEDLKASLDQAKQLQQAQMSEAQKAQALATEADAKRKQAEEQLADTNRKLQEAEAQRRKDLVDGAISLAAKEAGAEHAEDVVTWARLNKPADDLAKLVDEAGKVAADPTKKLIDEAKAARPSWFSVKGPGSPSSRGGRAPEPDADAKKRAALAQAQNLRRRF